MNMNAACNLHDEDFYFSGTKPDVALIFLIGGVLLALVWNSSMCAVLLRWQLPVSPSAVVSGVLSPDE